MVFWGESLFGQKKGIVHSYKLLTGVIFKSGVFCPASQRILHESSWEAF